MAQRIYLTSGSIFNGNPITFAVKPNVISGTPSFHRVILEIECGITGGNYEVIKMSSPVEKEDGSETLIDISSALRTFRDTYEYTPDPTTYPLVKFNVKAYDEYMLNGVLHPNLDPQWYPINPKQYRAEERDKAYLRTIFGAFTDIERITSSVIKDVTTLSRKPAAIPHLAFVGETIAYTPPYTTEQMLERSNTLVAPQSQVVNISKEGAQTINGLSLYALPSSASKHRQVFRFINSFGVLESISVPRAYSKKLSVTSTSYAIARQETFNKFSRSAVRKHSDRESWFFQTDPLTEEWLSWYLHEFLMSEHVWLSLPTGEGRGGASWLPVIITPEEDITFLDRTKSDHYQVQFTAQLDINGSPVL